MTFSYNIKNLVIFRIYDDPFPLNMIIFIKTLFWCDLLTLRFIYKRNKFFIEDGTYTVFRISFLRKKNIDNYKIVFSTFRRRYVQKLNVLDILYRDQNKRNPS